MEFWGVEVKAGQPLKVKPEENHLIHLSQASLGESKKEKGHGSVPVYVKLEDKKLVLGTLIPEKIPQLSLDLIFEQEFELSHNSKNGSIYFMGYQTPVPDDSEDFIMPSDDEEEELPGVAASYIARAEKAKPEKSKPAAASIANAAKSANLVKDVKPEEDDDEDESDDDDYSDEDIAMGEDSDEISGEDDDSDDSEDEDSDDEETPKKAEVGKKRPTESAIKTPVPTKKAKSPMTDGKKGGHVATPHPSKGVKTPNAKPQTPKSGGPVSHSSNSKGFKNKAKHSAK